MQVPVVLEAAEVWAVHSLVTPEPKMKLEYDSAQNGMQCQWFRCFSSGLVHPLPCKHSTKWQTPLQSRAEPGNNHEQLLLVRLLHRIMWINHRINPCVELNVYFCSLVGFLLHLRVRCEISACFVLATVVFSLLFVELQGGFLWALLCGLEVTCSCAVSSAPSHT